VSSEGPAVQGSLAYASPEHVHHLALDRRADQFSLGIVLLQLLTGRHLFEGAERLDARQRRPQFAQDAATRLCAHELAERIRDYSVSHLEAATRAVPEALRPLVHRALAPDRTERFDSCGHMSHTLRAYLRDTGQFFGRQECLAELMTLRYAALSMEGRDHPSDAPAQRMLQAGRRLAPLSLAGHRARPRGPPWRR
jgi:serine/threonine-protein kinase